MKKIGITTMYYKSTNYGGNYQAYALCKLLNKGNVKAEQLCYCGDCGRRSFSSKIKSFICRPISQQIKSIASVISKTVKNTVFKYYKKNERATFQLNLLKRKNSFQNFNNNLIEHSKTIYNDNNLHQSLNEYNAFFTGSDQVWNLSNKKYVKGYFLSFVPAIIPKFSYAASMPQKSLNTAELDEFKNILHDYKAVSVREKNMKDILSDVSPVDVEWVLDPTLLLNAKQWDEVRNEYDIEDDYLFCYFLGEDKLQRNIAKQFAKYHNLKVVTLPHLCNKYYSCDKNFADINLYDISPEQLLSLLKNAKYVFTDSFHASVFSIIYNTQFFTFQRKGAKGMSARIYSLIEIFEAQDRFCDSKEKQTLDYIQSIPDMNYNKNFEKFEEMKNKSLNYIDNCLNIIES